jgi:type IV fimbrial biogenesis protein FimT
MANRQGGATLIEFMLTFAIMGILVALAVPSFRDWIQNAQVRTATDAITSGLQLARAEAVRRNNPVRFRLPDAAATGWAVEAFDRNASTWTRVQQRSADEGTTNVVVNATQSTIVFLGTGGVSPTPPAAIQIDVSNPSGGDCVTPAGSGSIRCLRVTVSAGGQVRMCDPGLAAGSAASC